jgi:hypothetical protein
MFLAMASKSTPPEHKHPIPKHPQARKVTWHRVVVEVALDDRLEPSPGLGHGIMHALTKLLLHLSQLGSHALADGRAPHCESPQSILPADVREASEMPLMTVWLILTTPRSPGRAFSSTCS